MLWLWLFWIEVVLFCGYLLWSLFGVTQEKSLTAVRWVNTVLYGIAFLWSLSGLIRFARRRLAARS
jgi:hypothetical protein